MRSGLWVPHVERFRLAGALSRASGREKLPQESWNPKVEKKRQFFIAVRKCGDPRYSHDLQPPDKLTWESKKLMVCCLDVNVVFSKVLFSGFMFVFRGRNPSSHHGSVEHVSTKPVRSHLHVSLFNSSGFRGHNAWKTALFLKAIQEWTQTTHMLLQFYRFPPPPPKASSNQRAEINDFCESHFCSTEKTGSTFFGAHHF